jgi:hypothetical protein
MLEPDDFKSGCGFAHVVDALFYFRKGWILVRCSYLDGLAAAGRSYG